MPGVENKHVESEGVEDEELEEDMEGPVFGEGGIPVCALYNPDNLPVLEDYVREQMLNNTFDRTANLAVLKLYQFTPSYTNTSVVVSILALSLGNLPDPDLTSPSRCHFAQFWELLDADTSDDTPEEEQLHLLRDFPEFDTSIRKFISSTLASAYHSISVELLQVYLNLDGEDLADWISVIGRRLIQKIPGLWISRVRLGWEVVAPKPVIVQENIRFEQLTKIIGVGRLNAV
ncbi:armadillo-type protein [Chytridium lagenaria]|nr:armadillo-type protein [Chytridium lagenaria]